MLVIFDFDDILFDRDSFMKALAESLDFSYEQFIKSYNENFKEKGINYSLKKHLKILGKVDAGIKTDNLFRDLSNFLHKEAIESLKKFKSKNHDLILLTFGDKDYQSRKIKASGVSKHFDRVLTTRDKIKTLNEILPQDKYAIFINDKECENKEIKKHFPDLKIIDSIKNISYEY